MSQKLPVNNFEWIKDTSQFNKEFIKTIMKKVNLHDKTEYVIHIRNLKQALNHGLVLNMFVEWLSLIKMPGSNYVLT